MTDLMEDRNPESGLDAAYGVLNPTVPREHIKYMSDLLRDSINVGLGTTGNGSGQDAVIEFADQWLQKETGLTYEHVNTVLGLADAQDAIDWAWENAYQEMGFEEETYQTDAQHAIHYLSPGGVIGDVTMAGWSMVGDPAWRTVTGKPQLGFMHHLRRGWDYLGGADERLKGREPNPYGMRMANLSGVHNWKDAGWLALDIVDTVSMKYGFAVIEPTKRGIRNAVTRHRNLYVQPTNAFDGQGAMRVVDEVLPDGESISQIVRNNGLTDEQLEAIFEARNRAPYDVVRGGSDGPLYELTDPVEIWSYPMPVRKIISGGQTGGDEAGLYAGRDIGVETGGTAPAGWRTETGSNPDLETFGLRAHHDSNYPARTRQNVQDSDGTIYFDFHGKSAGLKVTRGEARRLGRPFLLITDIDELNTLEGLTKVRSWLVNKNIRTLNVAGNRQSSSPLDFDMFTNVRNWLNGALGHPPEELGFTGSRLNRYEAPQQLEVPKDVVTEQQRQRDLLGRIDEKRAAEARAKRSREDQLKAAEEGAPVQVGFLKDAKVEHRRSVVDDFDVHEIDADIRAQPPAKTDPLIEPPLEPKPVDGWQDSHMRRGVRRHEGRLNKPQTRVMGMERGVKEDGAIDYGTYFYTGKMFEAEPLTPLMKEIMERVQEITGYDFDIVLAQRYQNGVTDLGWHNDLAQKWDVENNRAIRQRGTKPESVVVSVNFGATRDFAFTNTKTGTPMPADQRVMRLGNGDVLIMMEGTNANYRHSILKADPNDVGLRINLTFRRLDPKLQAVPRRTAAGAIDEPLQDPSEIAAKLGRLEREKAEIVRRGSNASGAERRRLREMQEEIGSLKEARGEIAAGAGPRQGTPINYVKGQNKILSNFAELPFRFRGKEFKTAEGAYQAYKGGGYRPGYENLTGLGAKSKGRGKHTKTVKVDGEYWNVDLMREILREKYMQVPEFRDALDATAGRLTHPVGDSFWKRQFPELLEELRGSKVGMGDAGRTIRYAAKRLDDLGRKQQGPPGTPSSSVGDQFGPADDLPLADTLDQSSGVERFRAFQARGRARAREWWDTLSDEDKATAQKAWERHPETEQVFDPTNDYDVRNAYVIHERGDRTPAEQWNALNRPEEGVESAEDAARLRLDEQEYESGRLEAEETLPAPDAPSPVAGQTFKHFTTPESAAAIRAGSFDPSHPAVHKTGSKARLMPEEPGTPKNPPVLGDFLYLSVNDKRWGTVDVPTGTGRVIPSKEYPGLPHPDKDPPSVQEFYGADPSDRGHNDLVPGPKTWDYKKIEAEYARLEKEGAHISSFYDYDIQKWRTDIGGAVTTKLEALDYVVSRNARILTIDETTIKSLDDTIKDARAVGGQLTNSQGQKVYGLRRTPGNDSLMNYYADQGYDVVVIRTPEGDALQHSEYYKFWSEVGDDQIIVLNPDAVTLTAPPAAPVNRNPRTQKIQEFEQTGGGGGHEFLDHDEIKTIIDEHGDTWAPDVKAAWVDEIESEDLAVKADRVEEVKRFSIESVRAEPDKVYVFGDNMRHRGKGGQAVIRDEPNAFGIPTKNAPHMREDAFWSDDLYDTYVEIIDTAFDDLAAFAGPKTVAFPKDGIGTGRSQLGQRAPRLLAYINKKIEEFGKTTDIPDDFWKVGPSDPTDATAIARFDAWHRRSHRANTPPTAGDQPWGESGLTGAEAAVPQGWWTEEGWVPNPEYTRVELANDPKFSETNADVMQKFMERGDTESAGGMQELFDLKRSDPDALFEARQVSKFAPRRGSNQELVRNDADEVIWDRSYELRDPTPEVLGRGPLLGESRWPLSYEERLAMTELEQFKRTGYPAPEANLDPEALAFWERYWKVPSSEGKGLRKAPWYTASPVGSPGSVRTLSDEEILAIVKEHGWKWGDRTVRRVLGIVEMRAGRSSGWEVDWRDKWERRPKTQAEPWPTTIIGDERFEINPKTGELIPHRDLPTGD